ncbi:hypothetical protein [Micromonospora endolithica]|uniref:Uncharacterized protein n=1 Tax=Micromonospora endolithica TaxID=230091 RepID=A0A3A9ZDG0_9ACTN|nr:hypothetical protein [Micromonospora endolithica]RKN46462.1 hypothetical protein D7223_16325 [Micromonospora endolithica]TWJ24783.1 hypothetical protein JD76_04939 [Micromonospora endolithica]
MSYPDQAPARRPAVVTLAVALLAVMAVAALGYAVAGLLTIAGTVDALRSAAAGTSARPDDVDGVVALLWISGVASAVVSVLAALLLVGLAVGLRAGRPGARVGTWVVAGLGMLLGCCSLAVQAGQRLVPLRLGEDERGAAEVIALVADAYPGWWIPLGAGLSVGQVLGYVVVAVLLALPAANTWFRRRPATQPAPYAYPQPPGTPPAPPYPPR